MFVDGDETYNLSQELHKRAFLLPLYLFSVVTFLLYK